MYKARQPLPQVIVQAPAQCPIFPIAVAALTHLLVVVVAAVALPHNNND
jgi:hypothetical protein